MNINEVILYSHEEQIRRLKFKSTGLNVITGRSSTGKSALSTIVEYCMGRSTFLVPEGPLQDKVSWYGVIFQFSGEQVLVLKPRPSDGAASCSLAMIKRGSDIKIPEPHELLANSNDESVIALLSDLVGIPSNSTIVPEGQSRDAFEVSIKQAPFFVFQKQNLITSAEQLFYRQNEQYLPQAIKDSLPVFLGIAPDDRLEIEAELRKKRRDLKLLQKQIALAEADAESMNVKVLSLLTEAQQVSLIKRKPFPEDESAALELLRSCLDWLPTELADEDHSTIATLEDQIAESRKSRLRLQESLKAAEQFSEREDGFSDEVSEQKSRLESIGALPQATDEGGWQWPFAPDSLASSEPIAIALLNELQTLHNELQAVEGERPKVDAYISKVREEIDAIGDQLKQMQTKLAAAIAANEAISQIGNRNAAAAKVVGRISLFLERDEPEDVSLLSSSKEKRLISEIKQLEKDAGYSDFDERLGSVLNVVSKGIGEFVAELDAEFSAHPFRLDLKKLTVVIDRDGKPVPMVRTGGGANHLAYHLGSLLSLHRFAAQNGHPLPRFIFLDQPTQVYFPSETYEKAGGDVEATERQLTVDADMEKVRSLFKMLHRVAAEEAPGLQIIVSEHANLAEDWFQNSLVEDPWTKPPALVPEHWNTEADINNDSKP